MTDRLLLLDAHPLTPGLVAEIVREGVAVVIGPEATARMEAAAAVVRTALERREPVYGLTTGLGSRVVEPVDEADGALYSLRTLRGRATAVGDPLPEEVSRAAMTVRLGGLCAGGAGADPEIAGGLARLLNRRVHPVIPGSGSIGASDLCLMAHVGLTLIGEGEAWWQGRPMASAEALAAAGLAPTALGPRDGLALCSSSAVSVGTAALALVDAERWLETAQAAAALTMEGFRANLSPLDPRVVAARPAPGQAWAADGLRALLAGGSLTEPGAARRVQDPLSLRCAAPIHGSLRTALQLLTSAVTPELDAAADNPVVLAADEEIISTGNFHVPALSLALDTVAIGLSQVAAASAERAARLATGRLSGLPHSLTTQGPSGSGFGPLTKTGHALALEIRHRAAPYAPLTMVTADAVEDDSTSAAQGALRVREQLERAWRLTAVELVVAAQAVELAAPERLGAGTEAAYRFVRETVAPLDDDRPIGVEVDRLAARLAAGELETGRTDSIEGATHLRHRCR